MDFKLKIPVLLLILSIVVSCNEKRNVKNQLKPLTSGELNLLADETLSSLKPVFQPKEDNSARSLDDVDIIFISFDFVFDGETNEVSVMNFEEGDFFPLDSKSSTARQLSFNDIYVVACVIGDEVTTTECDGKWSCGQLIADCLELGGCATICKNPGVQGTTQRSLDVAFLRSQGICNITPITSMPVINTESNALRSVRLSKPFIR